MNFDNAYVLHDYLIYILIILWNHQIGG